MFSSDPYNYMRLRETSDLLFLAADLLDESAGKLRGLDPGVADDLYCHVEPMRHLLRAQAHTVADAAFEIRQPAGDMSTERIKRGCRIVDTGHECLRSRMYNLFAATEKLTADDLAELRESESAYLAKIREVADRRIHALYKHADARLGGGP